MNSTNERLRRGGALRFVLVWALFFGLVAALSPARAQAADRPDEYA